MNSPLESQPLFYLGPLPITQAIVTSWAIMAILVIGSYLLTRHLTRLPDKRQAALELMVSVLDLQIRETSGASPAPYRSFIGSLFLFILVVAKSGNTKKIGIGIFSQRCSSASLLLAVPMSIALV